MEEKLKLTKEQVNALDEFKAAVLKLRAANVLPIENRYANEIVFINGKNIKTQWVGTDFDECPFKYDTDPLRPSEIDEYNINFDVLFANYFLPDESICIEFKK